MNEIEQLRAENEKLRAERDELLLSLTRLSKFFTQLPHEPAVATAHAIVAKRTAR